MRILFICSEYESLIKTGGLADATRGLATALVAGGHQVTVILPCYAGLYQYHSENRQAVYFSLGGRPYGCAVHHLSREGVNIALIEHHDFFRRERPYDDGNDGYADNSLRFAFFCKAALEWCRQHNEQFDIIHGHDWQAATTAFYLKQHYAADPVLKNTAMIFTVHNGAYQQPYDVYQAQELELPADSPCFLALGLRYADIINTVSNGYRDELLHEPAANGLAWLYQQRAEQFYGILNGCDYQLWHPQHDIHLTDNYSHTDLNGKARCKAAFLQQYGLQPGSAALFVAVSRITQQKGYDYLIPALARWLPQTESLVVIVGSGEQHYCQQLRLLQQDFPQQFRFIEGFNEVLAHQAEAAGDFFLMPSLFEPCGLNQIYSLCYGTLPVVRLTGGLKDTILAWPGSNANGIGFEPPSTEGMLAALYQAEQLYQQPDDYQRLQQRGMRQNFSWSQSAAQYVQLYRKLSPQD